MATPCSCLRGRGHAALDQLLLLFVSLAATVAMLSLRRRTWRAPVWQEFKRVLYGVAVLSLPTTIATGILVGIALVTQAVYWLETTGQSGMVGSIIVVLLIREIVPILVGLVVFGRSGTATLIVLGEAQTSGWLRLFELQGLDPLVMLVVPRTLAFALGRLLHGHDPAAVDLAHRLPDGARAGPRGLFDLGFCRPRPARHDGEDFIVPPLKCILIGFMVALVCCATGLSRRDRNDELQRLVPRGFVRAALAILTINGIFDLVA